MAVDTDLGMVRTRRIVAVYDVGKVINEKLARSQFIGGIVWGVGLALQEDTAVDPRNGRIMNANLADYHVPVNADIGDIDVSAIDIPDPSWIRSAPAVLGKMESPGPARQLPMRFSMRLGSGFVTCRLRQISWFKHWDALRPEHKG